MIARFVRPFSAAATVAIATAASTSCIPNYVPPDCTGALCQAIPVGSQPNDVKLTTCNGHPAVVVAESGDSRVSTYDVSTKKSIASLDLTQNNAGSDPFTLALDEKHGIAMVTLNATNTVALFNPCTGTLLTAPEITNEKRPQPVIFDGTHWFVAFTNIEKDGNGTVAPVIDPGVVSSFETAAGNTLKNGDSIALPCLDPQGLAVDAGGKLWASCTGPLVQDGSGNEGVETGKSGDLLQLDLTAHIVTATVSAGQSAPSTPVFVDDKIYVGSDIAPKLLSAPATDGSALADALTFDGPAVDSVFEVKQWSKSLLLVAQFSADALRVVDVSGAQPTLKDTFQIGPGGASFHGLVAFDAKPDDPSFDDVDGAALFALSDEVVPLRIHTLDCCKAAP